VRPNPAVLGVKLVVVLGAKEGIDRTVRAAGREVRYVHGQRVTDEATMQAAVQAAGAVRMQFEARLSRVRNSLRGSCSVPVHCCHHHRTADAAWCNVDAL
jgi:acetylglutamate kinase